MEIFYENNNECWNNKRYLGKSVLNAVNLINTKISKKLKGSAGQAIQNMNIMFDFDEVEGLTSFGMYP